MTIDWGTKVINIFKTDMVQLQVSPTEIWRLDIPVFKAALGNLLDDTHGMAYPDIFKHNPEVSVGGVTLAKVIEILEPYTITFEDGQYAVNLVNANSNIGDRVNVNQVSVRSANSAGLTNVQEIQFSSYQGVVSVDTVRGVSGTVFPIGTRLAPANNLNDAQFIAALRGIGVILVNGVLTVEPGEDLLGKTFKGENAITTAMIIDGSTTVVGSQFEDMFIYNSVMSGSTYLKHVALSNSTGISGYIEASIISGNIGISDRDTTYFVDCKSGCVGLGTSDLPVLDLTGSNIHISFRNFAGPIKFTNSTHAGNTYCIDVASGATVILDASCTAGLLYIRGIAEIVNNSGMTVVSNASLSQILVAESIWTHSNRSLTEAVGLTPEQIIMLDATVKTADPRLSKLDANVSSRLASVGYTAPLNQTKEQIADAVWGKVIV